MPRFDVIFFAPNVAPLLEPVDGGAPAVTGGVESQVSMIAPLLAARGWRVGVVAYASERLPRSFGGTEVLPLTRPLRHRGPAALRAAGHALGLARLAPRMRARVVVQSPAGAETALVGVVARAGGSRFAYWSAHVVDFEFSSFQPRRAIALGFRLGLRLAQTLVLQTREQRDLARSRWRRNGPVVPYLAVDAAPREHPREFLWVGRLAPYKNPGAFVELARRLPEARFVMVAAPSPLEGPLRAELEAAARELPNLEVIPGLARPDVLDRLRRAVALVSTSDYEGMPNVFLEAWSRGAPVLALNHDPDDLIADHGLGTFAAGSPDRLARAAAELWRGREDQDELAARCQGFVRDEHGPELVAASWERALGLSEGYGTPGRAATQTT